MLHFYRDLALRNKLLLGLSAPLLLVAVMCVLFYASVSLLLNANRWVNHTHEAISYSDELTLSMINMETGLRGYLMSGKESFLEPYEEGEETFSEMLRRAKTHVSDNPPQVQRLDEVETLKENWLAEHAHPLIAMRRLVNEGAEAIQTFEALSARSIGKEHFDAIRRSIEELVAEFARQESKYGQLLAMEFLLAMVNQETGQRGYLLTGKEASLEPYTSGSEDLTRIEDELRDLIANDQQLRVLLDKVMERVRQWRRIAAIPEIDARHAATRFETTIDDVTAFVDQGHGKQRMDEIRELLRLFEDTERTLMNTRSNKAEGLSTMLLWLTVLSGIVVAGLGYLVCRVVADLVASPLRRAVEVSQAIADGDLSNEIHSSSLDEGGKLLGSLAKMQECLIERYRREREYERLLAQSEKLQSIGQLSAGIAHEINTPMQFVSHNLQFLSKCHTRLFSVVDRYRDLLDTTQQISWQERRNEISRVATECRFEHIRSQFPKAIEECRDGIEQTIKIVKAMKDFSHPGNKRKSSVNLNDSIKSTIEIARNRWKYSAELTLELDPHLPMVQVYAAEINQVLLNLIVNAADAISSCFEQGQLGHIIVRTRHDSDFIIIDIEDNGCGIPEEIRQRVFDPFFTTKEIGKGTGQGLSITHQVVVNMHGGEISLDSQLGQGTTFTVRLPTNPITSERDDPEKSDGGEALVGAIAD